jgi:hemolysin-activating ACP:hemolysin acyltransferase
MQKGALDQFERTLSHFLKILKLLKSVRVFQSAPATTNHKQKNKATLLGVALFLACISVLRTQKLITENSEVILPAVSELSLCLQAKYEYTN